MKFIFPTFVVLTVILSAGGAAAKSPGKTVKEVRQIHSLDQKKKPNPPHTALKHPPQYGDKHEFKGNPASHDLALRDLKVQFSKSLKSSHDDAFTDPSVGGLVPLSLKVFLPGNEGGP